MIAKALAHNGAAKVYIAGRRRQVLDEAAASLGPNVVPITCDVTSKDDLRAAAETIKNETGYVNLVVANSGILGPQVKPLTPETSLEEWSATNFDVDFDAYVSTFSVNTAAAWFTALAFLPLLDAGNKKGNLQQTSQFIAISSIGAFNKKPPGGWAYGQSKAAVSHLSKQLSVVLPQWNIRYVLVPRCTFPLTVHGALLTYTYMVPPLSANSIAPGFFPSGMTESLVSSKDGGVNELPTSKVPFGRMGDEKDMGGTVLYLASRAGAYTNGDVLIVDGGRLGICASTF